MRSNHAEAQARYRARQALKLAFFDQMDAERVRHLHRIMPDMDGRPETEAVYAALINHPKCRYGINLVWLSVMGHAAAPIWKITYHSLDPNARTCAAVALAVLASMSSFPVEATDGIETFGPDDPAVKQAQAEIAEMKRLGIWERHA